MRDACEGAVGCREPLCQVVHGRLGHEHEQGVAVAHALVERRRAHPDALGDGLHREPRGAAGLDEIATGLDDLAAATCDPESA